jgi:hypothetical protein
MLSDPGRNFPDLGARFAPASPSHGSQPTPPAKNPAHAGAQQAQALTQAKIQAPAKEDKRDLSWATVLNDTLVDGKMGNGRSCTG